MLSGGQFYDVLCAVVPLYVALGLGYGSRKWWGVVTPEQSAGISRFNALICMPPLVFEIIAFNDPYTMNNRLIAAYCLSNGVVLELSGVVCVGVVHEAQRRPITLFQASVMPNTIIVGIPVLSPLYDITGSGIAAIFIGQVLWLYPILLLYEIRAAKKSMLAAAPPVQQAAASALPAHGVPALMTSAEQDDCRIKVRDGANKEPGGESLPSDYNDVELRDSRRESPPREEEEVPPRNKVKVKEIAIRVGKKLACLPFTYATFLGIIYSLIAGRGISMFMFDFFMKRTLMRIFSKPRIRDIFHKVDDCLHRWKFGPPRILMNSLDIIGRITLGLTLYTIGLFMAGQKKLVTSWWVASYGAFCRFIVGPGAMGLASLLLGLRGDTLRFAILQAALPQAVISFVFAKDYNLHADVFTTAVSIQTIVFMPIVLAYYTLLEL